MTALVWNAPGSHYFETGVSKGVLFLAEDEGYAWPGIVSMTENVSGGEVESYYYDGNKYLDWILNEDYQATLEVFAAIKEFAVCDGQSQLALGLYATRQPRRPFSLVYTTKIGNDLVGNDYSYKINIAYNLTAAPAEKTRTTINDQPSAQSTSWTVYGVPKTVPGAKPTAHLVVDARFADPAGLSDLEEVLYGNALNDPFLPDPSGVISLLT